MDRRSFLQLGPACAAGLLLPWHAVRGQSLADGWCATWGTAPAGPPPAGSTQTFSNQTLRLIVRASIGGSRVRVRFSNEMGSTPLRIGAAHVGLRSSGATLVAGSGRDLLFAGMPGVTIAPGAPQLSDPVDLPVPAQADLAISLYLPDSTAATTIHDMALQAGYISSAGNCANAPTLPVASYTGSWPFLTEVDVMGGGSAAGRAVVALGDSITDGAHSSSSLNRRWPDALARRLQLELPAGSAPVGVVNRGISSNSMLTEFPTALLAGRDALQRFDRDVLATTGARWLFVLIGTNDILYSPSNSPIALDTLVAGYQQLATRARLRGLGVLAGTMPPFGGNVYYTVPRDAVRQHANDWIRNGGAFDAVADFDLALRDPAQPAWFNPAYDSGDHLHPNDAGYDLMARTVPLAPFTLA